VGLVEVHCTQVVKQDVCVRHTTRYFHGIEENCFKVMKINARVEISDIGNQYMGKLVILTKAS